MKANSVFAIVIFLSSLCFGLARTPELQPVWTGSGRPPTNLTVPEGFTVSPARAWEIVEKTPWALSLKHQWHIYSDSEFYYVHDTFLGAGPKRAFKQGVKVNGSTGEVVRRGNE